LFGAALIADEVIIFQDEHDRPPAISLGCLQYLKNWNIFPFRNSLTQTRDRQLTTRYPITVGVSLRTAKFI